MPSSFLPLLLLAATSAASGAASGAGSADETTILIRTINSSSLRAGLIRDASLGARDVFRAAGVETYWADCGFDGSPAACSSEPGPRTIDLRILSRPQAKRMGLSAKALGAAMLPPTGFGSLANVFSHQVYELARSTGVDRTTILARLLAHELGHLLLDESRHAAAGLMQATWTPADLREAARGGLGFGSAESSNLRAQAQARAEAIRDERVRLAVRVQDYAGLEEGVLKAASRALRQSFEDVDVEVSWLDCTPAEERMHPDCWAYPREGTRYVRILASPPSETGVRDDVLGAAHVSSAAGGRFANLYWDRIQALADGAARKASAQPEAAWTHVREGRVLGSAVAHELGHLLGLPHAKRGLMRAPWSVVELAELGRGALRFDDAEGTVLEQAGRNR